VVLARLEEHAVARADHLDGAAPALAQPGVKCPAAAPIGDPAPGAAIVSMKTAPVNQSLGPGEVSRLFLVICTVLRSCLLSGRA
jgi:hypothetical protein